MRKKYLVVVDMQNDFIDGVLGTPEAKAIVPKVVDKIKNWKGIIITTQDTHSKLFYNESQEGQKVPFHCGAYSDGWKINNDVAEVIPKGTNALTKNTFGSGWLMHNCEDRDVTLIGLCTDICVISNAILLQTAGCNVTIDAACCAGSTPENHIAALKVMKACCMDIENWNGDENG